MTKLRLLAALLVSGIIPASVASAQGRPIDEGIFLITRPNAPQATESFKIWRLEGGALLATGSLIAGRERVTSSLRTDSLGTPLTYSVTVREGSAFRDSLVAAAHGSRFQSHLLDQRGDESMREYPISAGNVLVLDQDLVHQLFFVTLAKRTGSVQLISPRSGRGGTATIQAHGLEPIEVGGHSVTAAHYSLNGGSGRRDFWVDSAGRLLRVEAPEAGLKAVREELPR